MECTLSEALRQEVEKGGDDVLEDIATVNILGSIYDIIGLTPEVTDGLKKSLSNGLVNIFHYHYSWDDEVKKQIRDFANKYKIKQDMMIYIAEAFAFAIELLPIVKHPEPPKGIRVRKLGQSEIENKIVTESVLCPSLLISKKSVEISDENITFTVNIFGFFTERFKGGVLTVTYIDNNNNIISSWYRQCIFTIPWAINDSCISGDISITVKRIRINQGIKKIQLAFDNFDLYKEIKTVSTDWFEKIDFSDIKGA